METSKDRAHFLLALLIGALVVSFMVMAPFLNTIALAAVFAVVLHPLYKKLKKPLFNSSGLAAFATLMAGCLMVLIPLSIVGTMVVSEASQAYRSLVSGASATSAEQVATSVGAWLEPSIPGAITYAHTISQEVNTYVTQSLEWLVSQVGTAFTGILGIFLRTLIFMMALYYFLKEGARLEKVLIKRSPLHDDDAATILKQLSRTVSSVVKGSLAIACIQGALAGIGFLVFGVPNAALWGVSTAVAALIPGVGTSLVLMPAVIYLFIAGSLWQAIGLLLWAVFLVGLIDNFLAPRLMGKGAQLHPLVILLSVLGGVVLYGPVGIFLGPLTISFLFAVFTVYSNQKAEAA